MALRLPEHSHCASCGNPTEYGTFYCDEGCEAKHKAEKRRTNIRDLLFYGTVAVALCILAYRLMF